MRFRNKCIALLLCLIIGATLISCQRFVAIMQPTPSASPTPTEAPTPTQASTPAPTPEPAREPTQKPALEAEAFRVGFGDDTRYSSDFFGFGFRAPKGWYYYGREGIDELNEILTSAEEEDAYVSEYIDRFKSGEVFFDYFVYDDKDSAEVYVFVRDFSDYADTIPTERSVLQMYQDNLFYVDSDNSHQKQTLAIDMISIGDDKHAVLSCERIKDGIVSYMGLVAVRQNTAYALVFLNCPDRGTLDSVLQSFYPVLS